MRDLRVLRPKGVDAPQWALDEIVLEVVMCLEFLQTKHHQVDAWWGDEDRVDIMVDSLTSCVNEMYKACLTEDTSFFVFQKVL